MRKVYWFANGRVVECPEGSGPILVFINPDETERRFLIDVLKVDEHTLGSALDPDELSRLEFEPDHVALILKHPCNYSAGEQLRFRVGSTGVFLFKDRLVVVMSDDYPCFEGSAKQLARYSSLPGIMLGLIYRSIFHFLGHLRVINAVSDELEQKINTSMENKSLLGLFTLEKSLVYYVNAIHTNGSLVERLRNNAAKVGFSPEEMELLDDITVENGQCGKQAEIYSNILAGLMDARASIVSNNLNVMMKNLNALVIAVAVPSFFAGVGGMSEFSMVTQSENWLIAYPIFILAMLALGYLTFAFVQRMEKHWQ